MIRIGTFTLIFILFSFSIEAQRSSRNYELGVEIMAASGSNLGGSVGGALKFAIVENKELAFGPSIRYQYFWSNNQFTGVDHNRSVFGGGGFIHYRFLDWFYVGSEIEVIQNPMTTVNPQNRWGLTGFIGGGIHKDFDWVHLNAGLLYDVVDAMKDPLNHNGSPLRNSYFMRVGQPPNQRLLPIIWRITFFFPLN